MRGNASSPLLLPLPPPPGRKNERERGGGEREKTDSRENEIKSGMAFSQYTILRCNTAGVLKKSFHNKTLKHETTRTTTAINSKKGNKQARKTKRKELFTQSHDYQHATLAEQATSIFCHTRYVSAVSYTHLTLPTRRTV